MLPITHHTIKILSLGLLVCALSFLQTPTKLIEWQAKPLKGTRTDGAQVYPVLDRVEIERFTVGKPVTIGEAFSAGDDWLQDLVIRVRNASGRRIEAIQVTLVLPQMNPGSPDVIYCYGCAPAEKEKGIESGDAVDLKMIGGGAYYDFVKMRAAEKGGIAQISKAEIRDMYVTLPDKTVWVSRCIRTKDAKNACPLEP